MKLFFLLLSATSIFPADSRNFPDKPEKVEFSADQDEHIPSDFKRLIGHGDHPSVNTTKNFTDISVSNHSSTDEDLAIYTASLLFPDEYQGLNFTEVVQHSLEERKAEIEMPLRATCNNKFWTCQSNANNGLCKDNPYMMHWCTKACGVCGGVLIGDLYSSAAFFTFRTEKKTRYWASRSCRDGGAQLANLNNPEAFSKYARNTYSGERFWLAGIDWPWEGIWHWPDHELYFGDFPWPTGQPDNWNGDEDCLEWGFHNDYNDENCEAYKGFVCEHASHGKGYNHGLSTGGR